MGVIETSGAPSLSTRLRGLRGRREGSLPATLYRENLAAVIRTLRRLGVNEADLPDVAQEVFIVAVRKRDELHGVASPRAWLFCVARRVASNHRRKRDNRLSRESSWATAGPPDTHPRPELELDLEAFLDTLHQRDREAFVLGQLEGMTRSELAEALNLSEGTAYSRLRRARAQLAVFFTTEDEQLDALQVDEGRHERALPALLLLLPPELLEPSSSATLATTTAGAWGLSQVVTGFAATLALALPVALIATRPEPKVKEGPPPITAAAAINSSPLPVSEPEPVLPPTPAPAVEPSSSAQAPTTTKPSPRKKTAHRVPPAPLPSQVDERAQASALELEVRLMAEARAALAKGERQKADAALRRLRAERPRPSLAEEAEALYTEFACRYQGEARGHRAFAAYSTRFPTSAYAKSLASLCPRDARRDQ